jgi:hypothetical protein
MTAVNQRIQVGIKLSINQVKISSGPNAHRTHLHKPCASHLPIQCDMSKGGRRTYASIASLQLDSIYCPYAAKSRNQTARDEIVEDCGPFLGEEPFFGDERLLPAPNPPCFSMAIASDRRGRRRKQSSDEIREEVGRIVPLLIKKSPNRSYLYSKKNCGFLKTVDSKIKVCFVSKHLKVL